jgi:hypothetical protein
MSFFSQKCSHGNECTWCAQKTPRVHRKSTNSAPTHCSSKSIACVHTMHTSCTLHANEALSFTFFSVVCSFCHEHTLHTAIVQHTVHTQAGLHFSMVCCFPGPRWFRKGSNKLLLASRSSNENQRCKTAGNIADGLRCSPWLRAEKQEKQRIIWLGVGKIALDA